MLPMLMLFQLREQMRHWHSGMLCLKWESELEVKLQLGHRDSI